MLYLDPAFSSPNKKATPPLAQNKTYTPSTPLRSMYSPISGSARKLSKDVSRIGEVLLSASSVTKVLRTSLEKQGLGAHVVPIVLDVLASTAQGDQVSVIDFVSEKTQYSKRSVRRKLLLKSETAIGLQPTKTEPSAASTSENDTLYDQQPPSGVSSPFVHQLNPSNATPKSSSSVSDPVADTTPLRLIGGGRRGGRKKRRSLEEIKESGDANHPKLAGLIESLERISNVRSGSDGVRHFRRAAWRDA